jgi:indole-3-glycerol phosphate synthase
MQESILTTIVNRKRQRLQELKKHSQLSEEKVLLPSAKRLFSQRAFYLALDHPERINFIAEIKRASPSKGVLREEVDPVELSLSYESHGAVAISVLTEEDHFLGSLEDLRKVKKHVICPVLRKDFIVDPYQVYEAAQAGADAILLITALLDDVSLTSLLGIADRVGLNALVEVHTREELDLALTCGAQMVGVNNRDLQTFRVDIQTSLQLAPLVPDSIVLVSESGISAADDVRMLKDEGYDAFLIGEYFMKSSNPGMALRDLLIRSLN